MIQWLQNYSGIKSSGENIEKTELENLRKEIKRYKKKYEKEDKEMEVSSESEEDVSAEEQKRIDEEMKKKQTKRKGNRTSVSAEVYGIHNVKKPFKPRVIPKNEEQIARIKERCMQSLDDADTDGGRAACRTERNEYRLCRTESVVTQADGREYDALHCHRLAGTGANRCLYGIRCDWSCSACQKKKSFQGGQ